jgi:hypothetical protein
MKYGFKHYAGNSLYIRPARTRSMQSTLSQCYGAHTRTNLASEFGWTLVQMSQTRPCVEGIH